MLIYQWLNRAKSRFYKIVVQKDGTNIVLDYHWGSCNTNRGGKKSILLCSEEEAQSAIDKMMKRRKSRGYELITS
jgi:predicted DNA-binding WGR domain protein